MAIVNSYVSLPDDTFHQFSESIPSTYSGTMKHIQLEVTCLVGTQVEREEPGVPKSSAEKKSTMNMFQIISHKVVHHA